MISVNNVTLRIGKKALFEDVNIKFTEGNCYGVIGANGAGKSTFLRILSGDLETTSGTIVITPGQRLSVLEQDHFKYDDYSVMDTVIMGNARLYEIMKEKDAIYAKEDFSDEDGIRVGSPPARRWRPDPGGWWARPGARCPDCRTGPWPAAPSPKKKEEKIKELQEFISRFSANASKSKQATSRKRALEKIELDDIRPSPAHRSRPSRESSP